MQAIKTSVDELALLGKPIDDEDLIDRVLEGLSDEYRSTAQPSPLSLPATENPTTFRNRPNYNPPTITPQKPGHTTAFSPHDQRQPKPYLGRCQACGTQRYCPSTPWQPRANHVVLGNNTTPTWLLDSGASHHVTFDLSNLSLHSLYQGSDDIMIDDGLTLPITHTGERSKHEGNPFDG
ncbi:Retrovirus-related Pol polyprotein from transposon RE2 [Vitis vinifera]|uniref:Retrovirus-related Pol polyprotein from transposon RE2 n=1 Tax=Vitis vinifera TaxID=29760 RepID=A0A438IP35_VITVI|nr:Retrovirus-related Pol polyprotein from transposon RE2 [Vitis vinifera]